MRAVITLAGVVAVAAGGVLLIGLTAASTATADTCPTPGISSTAAAAQSSAAAAQALRAGSPAVIPPTVAGAGPLCPTPTSNGGGNGAGGVAGGADAVFDPGNIASDEVFYNTGAMTLDEVTGFIAEQNTGCDGPWCLRNLRVDTPPEPADAYCAAYPGGAGQTAAQVILDVSRACGINPQVMLVTLQKESQGLTRTTTSESSWAAAWGWHCPDTGPGGTANCDPQYAGFFHQGYGMAHQWAKYRVEIPNGQYNYQPGRTYDILWNVAESGCGAAPVTIVNLATASLYVYTPYQPNAAALAAYPGEGDGCSAYGNRNFFRMFQTYFGSTGGGITSTPGGAGGGSGDAGGPVAVGGDGTPSPDAGGPIPVTVSGSTVTIPAGSLYTVWRGRDYAGTTITTPTPGIATGIAAGLSYLGLQYSWGGGNATGPTIGIRDGDTGDRYGDYQRSGFDCSGLTTYVAARYPAALPRLSADQRYTAPQQISWDQALPGDLVGYDGHITIYLGVIDGIRMQLESPQSGDYLKVSGVRSDSDPVVHRWWTG
jgi:cell wall-associated NlpC family hydrolase